MQKAIILLLIILLASAFYINYNQEQAKPENVLKNIAREIENLEPVDWEEWGYNQSVASHQYLIDYAAFLGLVESNAKLIIDDGVYSVENYLLSDIMSLYTHKDNIEKAISLEIISSLPSCYRKKEENIFGTLDYVWYIDGYPLLDLRWLVMEAESNFTYKVEGFIETEIEGEIIKTPKPDLLLTIDKAIAVGLVDDDPSIIIDNDGNIWIENYSLEEIESLLKHYNFQIIE